MTLINNANRNNKGAVTRPTAVSCKVILLILILFVSASKAQTENDLNRLRSQMAKQEKRLAALSDNKTELALQISITQKQLADTRRAVTLLKKQIDENNFKIKELQTKEKEAKTALTLYERQAARGLTFIINNSGTFFASAVISDPNGKKIIGVMEITDILNARMLSEIRTYASAAQDAEESRRSLNIANNAINSNLKELGTLSEEYKKSHEGLTSKLDLLKRDEYAQKEYLNTLRLEQERITKALKKSAAKAVSSGNGLFAKLKGTLPRPMQGTIIEPFGEKQVEGTTLKIMHKGVKIAPTAGGAVNCVADGTVAYINNINGLENIIIVRHDQDFYTVYANLDEFYVQIMDKVKTGSGLGRIIVDFEGNSSYLYFEIRRHEVAVNPAEWFQRL